MSDGIVLVVDLPQPLDKVSDLLRLIAELWPKANLNVKPEGAAAQLGNWLIHIAADEDRPATAGE